MRNYITFKKKKNFADYLISGKLYNIKTHLEGKEQELLFHSNYLKALPYTYNFVPSRFLQLTFNPNPYESKCFNNQAMHLYNTFT